MRVQDQSYSRPRRLPVLTAPHREDSERHRMYGVVVHQGEAMNIVTKYAAAAAIAVSLAVSGCNVLRGQSSAGEYVDDVAITSKVKTELLESDRVDGLDVNVDSLNGRVTLKGWASSASEARVAGDIARSVDGVKSVDNQLQVKQ